MLMEQWASSIKASGREYVPIGDFTWPWARCVSRRVLLQRRKDQGGQGIRSTEHLVTALSSRRSHISLRDKDSPITTDSHPQPGRSFLVWKAFTTGVTVESGTIALPEGSVLMLLGSGAHFQNTTFTGGIVMCAGQEYSGTFRNCTFSSTAVYSVHGAAPTLHGCTITGVHPGLVAAGDATLATLVNSEIFDCSTGIAVERGATAAARRCRIKRTDAAVVVTGGDSSAILDRCYLKGNAGEGKGGVGVSLCEGAARIRSSVLAEFATAFADSRAHPHERLELTGVVVEKCESAVSMHGGSHVSVRESELRCAGVAGRSGAALKVASGGPTAPCMQLVRSVVAVDSGAAVSVACEGLFTAYLADMRSAAGVTPLLDITGFGARVSLSHCSALSVRTCMSADVRDVRSSKFLRAAMIRMCGGQYTGALHACVIKGPVTAHMHDVQFRGATTDARAVVSAEAGAEALLRGCTIENGGYGLQCNDAHVRLIDTVISDIRTVVQAPRAGGGRVEHPMDAVGGRGFMLRGGAGVMLSGGSVEFHGGHIKQCIVGVETASGVGVDASNTEFTSAGSLSDVVFEDCLIGVLVRDGCRVELADCHMDGVLSQRRAPGRLEFSNKRVPLISSQAVYAMGGTCTLDRCFVSGYRKGVSVGQGADVTLRWFDMHMSGCAANAVGVLARGKLALEDCCFSGPGPAGGRCYGVKATGGSCVSALRVLMQGITGECMRAEGSADVTVTDSAFISRCGTVFAATKGGQMAVRASKITDARIGLQCTGGKITASEVTVDVLGAAVDTKGRAGTSAVIEVSTSDLCGAGDRGGIRGAGDFGGVRAAGPGASVTLHDCQVRQAQVGVAVVSGATLRMHGGVVRDCFTAVRIGDGREDLEGHCEFCGGQCDCADRAESENVWVRTGQMSLVEWQGGLHPVPRQGAPRCAHEGCMARADLRDVELRNYAGARGMIRSSGVVVNMCGRLMAENVAVVEYAVGWLMHYHRMERSVFWNCRAVRCEVAGLQQEFDEISCDEEPKPLNEILSAAQ